MVIAGFDIGGTKCAALLAETDGENIKILVKEQFKTEGGWQNIAGRLCALMSLQAEKTGIKINDIKGIGISCGGPLDSKRGIIMSPPNLPGWDGVHICEYIGQKTGIPARLKNDADACALAEWKYGAGKGTQNMIFLTFGTGLGAGLILNGKLYSGTCGMAGEIGHIRMAKNGPEGYGKAGSFEGFCSGGGIARLAIGYVLNEQKKGNTPRLLTEAKSIGNISARLAAGLALQGDPLCIKVYKKSAEILGRGLSILIDALNPEMIIIGGVYMRSRELFDKTAKRIILKETLPFSNRACRIEPALLGENIGDYGAAVAALED